MRTALQSRKTAAPAERMRLLLRLQAVPQQSPERPVRFRIPPKGAGTGSGYPLLFGLKKQPPGPGMKQNAVFSAWKREIVCETGGTYDKEIQDQ